MPERRIAKLERLKISDSVTARFFIRPGSRSRPWTWFEPDEVPPFAEEAAWFELVRERRCGWKVLRQVPKPAWAR